MSDITANYIEAYLETIQPIGNDMLLELEISARKNRVPIIKHDAKEMLKLMLKMHQPKTILEIGTAVGFSAITMLEALEGKAHITTIERSQKMIDQAKGNFKAFRYEEQVTLLEGDSEAILPTLIGEYDCIFMDAAKGQYMTFLPMCLDLLKDGGILISDNVLQDGYIAKSKWSIPRRQRTIHGRMRDYLWELTHNEVLETAVIPISDGMTISIKRSQNA